MARGDVAGQGLVAAILAAPDDDGPRLVYADWLLERGDWRGELIRVQCELAAGAAATELRARDQRLLDRLAEARPDWAGEWPPTLRRGFADHVVVRDAAAFLANAAEICRQHPLAAVALRDGLQVVARAHGGRHAVLTTKEEGAGVTLDIYSSWTTTTVTVFDRDGRQLHSESSVFEKSSSSSGESESGDVIKAIALSPDGQTLTLTMSAGNQLTREL